MSGVRYCVRAWRRGDECVWRKSFRRRYFPSASRRTGSNAAACRMKPRSFGCEPSVAPSASSPSIPPDARHRRSRIVRAREREECARRDARDDPLGVEMLQHAGDEIVDAVRAQHLRLDEIAIAREAVPATRKSGASVAFSIHRRASVTSWDMSGCAMPGRSVRSNATQRQRKFPRRFVRGSNGVRMRVAAKCDVCFRNEDLRKPLCRFSFPAESSV